MDLIALLIGLLVNGLIVGGVGRLLLPGPDPIGLPLTILVGVIASVAGGTGAYLAFGEKDWIGFLSAFAFAVALVYLIRTLRGGHDERVTLDPQDLERPDQDSNLGPTP